MAGEEVRTRYFDNLERGFPKCLEVERPHYLANKSRRRVKALPAQKSKKDVRRKKSHSSSSWMCELQTFESSGNLSPKSKDAVLEKSTLPVDSQRAGLWSSPEGLGILLASCGSGPLDSQTVEKALHLRLPAMK